MISKRITILVALFAVVGGTMMGAQTLAKAMDGGRRGMTTAQNQIATEKRAEIQQRLTTMKEARTVKLEAKRLEVCQQRQQKINDIVTRGIENNTKQLAVFQKIAANVEQFYVDKHLTSDAYDAAVASVNTAEANAVAAIEASSEVKFDCGTTDGTKPGSVIKEAMTSRHSALATYRTSIKDLIVVVKKANGEQRTADQATPSTNGVKE